MRALFLLLRALAGSSRGATAVEYGLILALVVLALIASLTGLADVTSNMWSTVSQKVQDAG